MKKIYPLVLALSFVILPAVTFAQTQPSGLPTSNQYLNYYSNGSTQPSNSQSRDLSGLITKITGYLNQALVLMMGIAMVIFVWWVIQYYIKPNDERAKAGSYVLYSLIGFFVILSVWGLVNILKNTFGFDNTAPSANDLNSLFPH